MATIENQIVGRSTTSEIALNTIERYGRDKKLNFEPEEVQRWHELFCLKVSLNSARSEFFRDSVRSKNGNVFLAAQMYSWLHAMKAPLVMKKAPSV